MAFFQGSGTCASLFTAAALLFVCMNASADDRFLKAEGSCTERPALVSLDWESVEVPEQRLELGEWKLPISPSKPWAYSLARMKTDIEETADGRLVLHVHFSYPASLGLLFTFQGIWLDWSRDGRQESSFLDWSSDCEAIGRSLVPGKSWSVSVDLGDTPASRRLDSLRIRLWGSQN